MQAKRVLLRHLLTYVQPKSAGKYRKEATRNRPFLEICGWVCDRMKKNIPCPTLSPVLWAKGWETTNSKRSKFMRSQT